MTKRTRSSGGDGDDPRYWFDEDEADRAVAFIEQRCCFDNGQPFILQPWQRDFVRKLFGTKRRDNGCRRYRIVFMSMGRGNGKTPLMAAVGAYLLFTVAGAQIYAAAADREQAAIVVTDVKNFINASKALARRCEILRNSITIEARGAFWRILTGRPGGKHGLRPLAAFFDELHEQRSPDLWDALYTARGKNPNSLIMATTTAGFNRQSLCWQIYDRARKVRDGVLQDDEFLPVIYEPAEGDDWTEVSTWKKSNPNFGVTVQQEFLASECKKALEQPGLQNRFRRLYLNEWTNQEHRAIDMRAWARCGGPLDLATLSKRPCWVGIDLSSKQDLTAAAAIFPLDGGEYAVLAKFWLPEEGLTERIQHVGVRFDLWRDQGFLELTPGSMVDYDYIRRDINRLREFYDVQEVVFDPWRDAQIAVALGNDGFRVIDYPARPSMMNEPTRYLLALVAAGKFRHGDNPMLAWNAGNLVIKESVDGFIRPVKDSATPTQGIDGLWAAVVGLARAMKGEMAAPTVEVWG